MDAKQLITFLSPKAPRRLRVIENILVGKRTVSTLYWGMRYHQLPWLGYEKKLSRQAMDQAVHELKTQGLVNVAETNAQLTVEGAKAQQQVIQNSYQPENLNIRLVIDIDTFWVRLLLATQVVSEQAYQNGQYYPLQAPWAVKQWIKQWFRHFHDADLKTTFYDFWQSFFTQLPDQQAMFMSQLLVGHERPGETLGQVAQGLSISETEARVMATDLTCQLAKTISQTQTACLNTLLAGLKRPLVSTSAQLTLNSFMAGESLETISHNRSLKLSTVREHLLEAAILLPKEQFAFQRILTPELVGQMSRRLDDTPIDDWQFKQVEDLPVEFWQFRLLEILRSKQTDDQHGTTL
ncbi:hypothetical protein HC026_02710 [Lactobacillus sp. LC28-10]|uniref:Helicase Helix-turn-helix domain-containing protein n=1 Tax=Secundilactobacillus angelensis TaxID=2722706 RepID=A0ABX1KYE2_9LACO|nr:helix-turn-helix domain-containing protein [Secundilactobacillus angelensis]MCH5461359.1 helix-turn-helix domain-containing protein [Secundilactobacillus angelensis]NLR17828.1 hypothetical protein [Secundilactobacillus angelensis]